jgi:hypothetical protein
VASLVITRPGSYILIGEGTFVGPGPSVAGILQERLVTCQFGTGGRMIGMPTTFSVKRETHVTIVGQFNAASTSTVELLCQAVFDPSPGASQGAYGIARRFTALSVSQLN